MGLSEKEKQSINDRLFESYERDSDKWNKLEEYLREANRSREDLHKNGYSSIINEARGEVRIIYEFLGLKIRKEAPPHKPKTLDSLTEGDKKTIKINPPTPKTRSYDPPRAKPVSQLVWNPLREIIAKHFSAAEKDITPATRITYDLGADPLDLAELYFEIEDQFKVYLEEEKYGSENGWGFMHTVGDMGVYIEMLLAKKTKPRGETNFQLEEISA